MDLEKPVSPTPTPIPVAPTPTPTPTSVAPTPPTAAAESDAPVATWSPAARVSQGLQGNALFPSIGGTTTGEVVALMSSANGNPNGSLTEVYAATTTGGGLWTAPLFAGVPNGSDISTSPAALAAGPNGKLYKLQADFLTGTRQLYFSVLQNGAWSANQVITSVDSNGQAMAVSADGVIHVIYDHVSGTTATVEYIHSTDGNTSWSAPQTINPGAGNWYGDRCALAATSTGELVAFYTLGVTGTFTLFGQVRSASGQWGQPIPLNNGRNYNPAAAGYGQEASCLFQVSGTGGGAFLVRYDAGAFSTPVAIDGGSAAAIFPALTYDSAGKLHAFWISGSNNAGATKQVVTDSATEDRKDGTVESAIEDKAEVTSQGKVVDILPDSYANIALMYSTQVSGGWSPPVQLAANRTSAPAAYASADHVYIAYQQATVGQPWGVYVMSLATASPPPPPGGDPFEDLDGNVFRAAIDWLYARGLANGTDHTHFSPALPIRRDQAAQLIYAALQYIIAHPGG